MTVDEILVEAEKLSTEEKMRLIEGLGSRTCCAVMGELWDMHRRMRECVGPSPEGGMEAMMRRMMGAMGGKGAQHG